MRTFNKKLILLIIATQLVSCATHEFDKKVDSADVDLLNEESLMRYNTNRLDLLDTKEKNYISKALLACHEEKFAKGQNILEEQMDANKTNPVYWNALGTCYSLKKDYPKALFYYGLGTEALPMIKDQNKSLIEATLINNVGLIHLNFKRYNEAYEAFKKANAIAPSLLTPEFNLAQLYIEFNQDDKALLILKRLEAKNPNDIDTLYSLSLIYFRKNDFDKSYNAINRIKSEYRNRPDIVGLYAYNLMKKNRLDEAREIIEHRLYADAYDQRNKLILEEINQKIKEQSKTQKVN